MSHSTKFLIYAPPCCDILEIHGYGAIMTGSTFYSSYENMSGSMTDIGSDDSGWDGHNIFD